MSNVILSIKNAIGQLRKEQEKIDHQISALMGALKTIGGRIGSGPAGKRALKRSRWKMTAAQKKAISRRMKAYWAARKKA